MDEGTIIPIERLDFRLVEWQWPFAHERRDEIASHFKVLEREKPAIWNGRVFLLRNYEISKAEMRGEFFETGFAELLAWRDWGITDHSVQSCFSMAAIESADNGFLLGVMGQHTANPGKVYFPTGAPDAKDLDGERVDLDKSVRRELAEETGLEFRQFQPEAGWHAVFSGTHIALMKRLRSFEPADRIRARILAFLACERQPELADIRVVYENDDLTPMVPSYVKSYLEHVWRTDKSGA